MSKIKIIFILFAVIILIAGAILIATWVYSTEQLQALRGQAVYLTPEKGAQELIARYYSGVNKVEIVHAGREILEELWFVEVRVWDVKRSDGKGFSKRDYDKPGWFFLHVQNGWVFFSESKFPEIIAFGKWLYGLS
jgi:hypothetical protein